MAWIEVIDERDAGPELRRAYESIRGSRGKVANILAVHSLNPAALRAHLELYQAVVLARSGLSRPERETVAVAVSAANGCAYCTLHHAEALNHYWRDDGRVERLVKDYRTAGLEPRSLAAVEYAVKLTLAPADVVERDVACLRAAGLNDAEVLDLNLVASYFNFVNRIAEGLGVEVNPEEVAGYRY